MGVYRICLIICHKSSIIVFVVIRIFECYIAKRIYYSFVLNSIHQAIFVINCHPIFMQGVIKLSCSRSRAHGLASCPYDLFCYRLKLLCLFHSIHVKAFIDIIIHGPSFGALFFYLSAPPHFIFLSFHHFFDRLYAHKTRFFPVFFPRDKLASKRDLCLAFRLF